MKQEWIDFHGTRLQVYSLNTVIVGTGAAGFNAADRLFTQGQKDIAIITEGLNSGTSRNTGSDKQTYYKLTLSGDSSDSVYEMAKTLFNGGSMHGDIALVEAALSSQCFYHLVDIGVPFPHNRYGEYVGYKTDHDPRQRATSAGPLTSRYMTEKLQEQVRYKGIQIFDGYQVIGILTNQEKGEAVGLIALNLSQLENEENRYVIFNSTNIIYATGAPARIYAASVYPESQSGASGLAFEAGVKGKNLTESQYGIASTKFRWNLSGTYQQVLPRYVSTDQEGGDEREFLEKYFPDAGRMLDCIFLKGYQWPFDPRKLENFGSSIIDYLVYVEQVVKGRRVFLDFMKNPSWGSTTDNGLDFSLLGNEAYPYLKNSNALFGKPIDRLAYMNQPAIDLYENNGIDLRKEYLEIAVCAQHNNGGLYGNLWWESNIKHFFPVGEVNGSHGVYRPGGSALNAGQVGSTRAAQFIAARYGEEPLAVNKLLKATEKQLEQKLKLGKSFLSNMDVESNMDRVRSELREKMSGCGAHVRCLKKVQQEAEEVKDMLMHTEERITLSSLQELPDAFKNYDLLISAYVYLQAIADYIKQGGRSRGSYLIVEDESALQPEAIKEGITVNLDDGTLSGRVQVASYKEGTCSFEWQEVRPIPTEENWFENVWNAYRKDEIIK